jgi:hypothetical protein
MIHRCVTSDGHRNVIFVRIFAAPSVYLRRPRRSIHSVTWNVRTIVANPDSPTHAAIYGAFSQMLIIVTRILLPSEASCRSCLTKGTICAGGARFGWRTNADRLMYLCANSGGLDLGGGDQSGFRLSRLPRCHWLSPAVSVSETTPSPLSSSCIPLADKNPGRRQS